MYSLWLARELIDEPVLLVESDVVFSSDLLAPLLEPDRIAVSRQLPWMNGSTVTLDADGYVNALYSPPPGIYFQHCTSPDHFITVNMCSLAAATWRDVGERLDRYVAAGHTGYFHDVVFADMIAEGSMALAAVLFPENRWYEVDTPADREAAELVVAGFPRMTVGGPEQTGAWRDAVSRARSRPSLVGLVRDLPNLFTLAGLAAAVLGVFFALRGIYPAAMMALVWAVVFDWTDGIIARRMGARTADQRSFGAQLDSLVDIVSFSVAPALVLLSVGDFSAWFVPGVFVILAAGAIRLSHFNVFGLLGGASYRGLSLDNNVLVLALLFVAEPLLPETSFAHRRVRDC